MPDCHKPCQLNLLPHAENRPSRTMSADLHTPLTDLPAPPHDMDKHTHWTEKTCGYLWDSRPWIGVQHGLASSLPGAWSKNRLLEHIMCQKLSLMLFRCHHAWACSQRLSSHDPLMLSRARL